MKKLTGILLILVVIATISLIVSPFAGVIAAFVIFPVIRRLSGEPKQTKRASWDSDEWKKRSRFQRLGTLWPFFYLGLLVILIVSAFSFPDLSVGNSIIRNDRYPIGGSVATVFACYHSSGTVITTKPNYTDVCSIISEGGKWGGAIGSSYDVKKWPFVANTLSVTIRFYSFNYSLRVSIWSQNTDGSDQVTHVNFEQVWNNITYHIPIETSSTYVVSLSFTPYNTQNGLNSTEIDVTAVAEHTLEWGAFLQNIFP